MTLSAKPSGIKNSNSEIEELSDLEKHPKLLKVLTEMEKLPKSLKLSSLYDGGLLQLFMISELVVRLIMIFYDFGIFHNAFNVVSL